MAEGLGSEVADENQALRDQHRVAAERVQEAESILSRAQEQLRVAQEGDPRGGSTPATAEAEQEVFRAEGLVEKEKDRLETHLKMTGMAASENLDILAEQAKTEMDEDLAPRGEQLPEADADMPKQ